MKNNKTFAVLINEISAITSQGHDILEVKMDDEVNYFLVDSFEPPIGGNVHTAPFLQFNGILINDFLNNSIFNQGDLSSFNATFYNKYSSAQKMNFKLSDNHKWRFYSK